MELWLKPSLDVVLALSEIIVLRSREREQEGNSVPGNRPFTHATYSETWVEAERLLEWE